jgi:hypothetical protein
MTFISTPIDKALELPTRTKHFQQETKSITVFDTGDPSVGIPATEFTLESNFYFDEQEHLEDFKRDLMKLLADHDQTQGRTSALTDWELDAMQMELDMDKAMQAALEFEIEVRQHNDSILSELGETAKSDLAMVMQDCDQNWQNKMEWVEEPKGSPQPEDDCGVFQNIHVDQWQNGGYSGDSFAGDIYAQVGERWLRIPYTC